MRKLTFNELLHKINSHASKLPKTPTAKYLRENAGTPLLQTEDGIITVYSNGYAIYKNERQTVLWITDYVSFTYHFVYSICSLYASVQDISDSSFPTKWQLRF